MTPGLHLRLPWPESRWSTDQGHGKHGEVCSEGRAVSVQL